MNDLNLYQLVDEYRQVLDLAASEEADEESFGAALAALQGEITTRTVSLAQVARNLETFEEKIEAAIEAMGQRAARARKRANSIRAFIKMAMESAGIHKVESSFFTVAIKRNPPKLIVADDALIPSCYLRVIPERLEPNKQEISRALKAGAEFDWCRIETSTRLEIK